jgi:hypothetical protein
MIEAILSKSKVPRRLILLSLRRFTPIPKFGLSPLIRLKLLYFGGSFCLEDIGICPSFAAPNVDEYLLSETVSPTLCLRYLFEAAASQKTQTQARGDCVTIEGFIFESTRTAQFINAVTFKNVHPAVAAPYRRYRYSAINEPCVIIARQQERVWMTVTPALAAHFIVNTTWYCPEHSFRSACKGDIVYLFDTLHWGYKVYPPAQKDGYFILTTNSFALVCRSLATAGYDVETQLENEADRSCLVLA